MNIAVGFGRRCEWLVVSPASTVQNRTRLRWRQVAWAQRGLVPAWKGEVVHPGAPESQCVYKTRCYRILSVLSLYELNSNKPRYHKNSRAYKVPQFLERRLSPSGVAAPGGNGATGAGNRAPTSQKNPKKLAPSPLTFCRTVSPARRHRKQLVIERIALGV
jgi:hypothetical protein